MDSGRGVKLVKVKGQGELEVTTTGIQLLQSFSNPVGIISIIGPPKCGKSYLANKILGTQGGFETEKTTKGIWVWSEPIKILLRDEAGSEKEGEVLVVDCESILDRGEDHKRASLEVLALANLLSSHIVLMTTQPINSSTLNEVEILTEISSIIQIKKGQESKNNLYNYLPTLTWVVTGSDLSEYENYLERSLAKMGEDDPGYKIKASIKHFYKKRDFFNLNIADNVTMSSSKDLFGKLVTQIRSATELKRISGKAVSGAILCNMVQAYVHRINKKAPAVIYSAFERAVAAESRRSKEKLFIRYLDKMGLMENDLPCDEENLLKEHQTALKELLKEFDMMMMNVFEQEEVQEERSSLIDRINAYYEDLKSANLKSSESKCREVFKAIFDPLRQSGLKFSEDGTASISELEQQFLAGIQRYQEAAAGPCADSVFSEEISFLIPHMCTLLREIQNHIETEKEELQKEVKSLTRHRDEARAGEKRLRDLLEETNKNYEKQLEQRAKEISDLQANVNTRIHMAENKARTQAREIQGLKLELEQAQKEREMMIEAERDIYEKRIADLDSKMYKLQLENSKYERMLDDLREEQEKLIAEKNEQINDLSRKLKLIESQPDPNPRQDASVLRSFKDYLEDIFNKFSKEQNANAKYLSQLERVANLQNELNQVRIREQETRNKLIDEYEEKLKQLRVEKDIDAKNFTEAIEKQKEELKVTFESVSGDMEKQSRTNAEREEQIKRLMEEKLELSNELGKREQQLSDQYEVIDAYKKQMDQLQNEIEDRNNMLNKLKIENVEEKDDNDILVNFMGTALEAFQKRKNTQTIHIGRIQNHDNRTKVAKLFKKFGIPYE
ncbi:hypothetical protein SteCoe_4364 [Stentor coeruleus]|uniref:GB1/RHD3-type G domain-containing protein n=1 Tax=Stentor coeruleus TaxID=5963 RepID=A0A1R2CUY0_9CILI|nr:hypothetical protein SteCoe_4364 [Stentor coeruleus]